MCTGVFCNSIMVQILLSKQKGHPAFRRTLPSTFSFLVTCSFVDITAVHMIPNAPMDKVLQNDKEKNTYICCKSTLKGFLAPLFLNTFTL